MILSKWKFIIKHKDNQRLQLKLKKTKTNFKTIYLKNAMTLNLFAVGLLFVFVGNLISELLNPPKKLAMIIAMLAIIMRIQTIKMRNQNKKKE